MENEQAPDDMSWTDCTETIELSEEALQKMAELVENPPPPSGRLIFAARRLKARTG